MQINGVSSNTAIYRGMFEKNQTANQAGLEKTASPDNANATATGSSQSAATPSIFYPTLFADLTGKSYGQAAGTDFSRYTFGGDVWNEVHKTFANGTYTTIVDTNKAEKCYKTLSATNSDGTPVSVTKNAEGDEVSYRLELNGISLDFKGDMRLGKNEDGNYLVYSTESGRTTVYNADGTVYSELEGDATSNASNKIYIDTSGAEIQGTDEDELFFILGENTKVNCGDGNDTIVLPANSYGAQIDTGQGNNTITGYNVFNAQITTGDGENNVNISRLLDTNLSLGDGNNKLHVGSLIGGEFTSGNGDNIIHISGVRASSITIGNGDNTVDIYDLKYNSAFNIGNGNNQVEIYEVGASDSDLASDAYRETGQWILGVVSDGSKENADLKAQYANKDSNSLNFGNGDNYLHIYGIQNNSTVNLGNGNNTAILAVISNSGVAFGDGDNTISIGDLINGSTADIGNGDNYIILHNVKDNSAADIGDGNNAIIIGTISSNGNVSIGDGNNDITIHDLLEDGQIFLGDGQNTVEVYRLRDNAIFSIGGGDNAIAFNGDHDAKNLVLGGGSNSFYNQGDSRFNEIREERQNSGNPAILNSGKVFKDAKPPPQTELIKRIGMLSSWNAPKFITAH